MQNPEKLSHKSIQIIHWSYREIEEAHISDIEKYYQELCEIVDGLPSVLKIYFADNPVRENWAVNGHAHTDEIITVSFNPHFSDVHIRQHELRALVFHESIHVKQKFVAEGKPCSALEAAVHEGVASIFEREYAGSEPEYVQYDSNKTTQWYGQLKLVAPEIYFEESGETFRKFAFHDPEDGEDWKVYKTGVWLVEKFMYAKNLKIIDMIDIPAKDVIQFYEMTGASLR